MPLLFKSIEFQKGKVSKATQIEVLKKKFIFNKDRKTFTQLPYPISDTLEYYMNHEGIEDDIAQKKADLVYGPNKISIPIPDFITLYKEHLVMPFFVF